MQAYREEKKIDENHSYPFEIWLQSRRGKSVMAEPHYHDYVEILYCYAGSFEAYLGDQRCRFGAGDMVIIHPQEVHRMASLDPVFNEYVVLKFDPGMVLSADKTSSELKYLWFFSMGMPAKGRVFRKETLDSTFIPSLVEELLAESDEKEYGFDIAVRAGMCRLFLWLLRQWRRMEDSVTPVQNISVAQAQSLQKVFDYIDCNYREPLHMQTMAEMLNLSYSAFSKFFNSFTCKSFSEYLNEVRIQKSKILLATTDMNITEIAMEVGFSNSSYYIQCFKARNRITPQKFRSRYLIPAENEKPTMGQLRNA